jgi:hypothetical protein
MSQIQNRFLAGAIVAAGLCSTALALSAPASADPVTPANPGLPGVIQQIANAAQSALTGAPPAPATPPTPPAAIASVSLPLPQPPSAPMTSAVGTVPMTQPALPAIPGLPLQLPADFAGLLSGGLLPGLAAKPATAAVNSVEALPAGVATGAQNPLAALLPFSALP